MHDLYLLYLVDVTFNISGIPIGTNCAPLLFELFLFLLEANFMQELVKNYDKKLTMVFNFAFRLYDAFVLFNLQFGVLW